MHYVMSDIHGNKEAFDKILSMICLQPEDHLYILGDVIDRGKHGIELLQQIRRLENCTLLMGNHEFMMVDALRNPDDYDAMDLWESQHSEHTLYAFDKLTSPEQEDLLCYLEHLPFQIEVTVRHRKYILVHAAPQELYEHKNAKDYELKYFMVWHRLRKDSVMPPGKYVIFGHTPVCKISPAFYRSMHIYHGNRMIAIDCASGFPQYGGQLGCIRLEDMTEFYSDDGVLTKQEAEAQLKRKDEFI